MDVANLADGGAPVLGEPLPLEFGNTVYAVRGRPRDGLETAEHLAAWLRDVRARLAVALSDDDLRGVTDDDLISGRELRDAIRLLADAAVAGQDADPDAVATLNRHARQTPRWPQLRITPEPHVAVGTAGRSVAAVLTALAEDAIHLFGGPLRHEIHACHGPGCVLYFVRDSSRREWCSPGCGNRARAARHYAKVRKV
ncbi:CGNR zinc finger domain-containing protein [Nonomuraea cavernae]|uniref:Zinc finger CGNR domain-containing protein n=1 Tax=Nonomuraea cavernae TaxID=2045107 RepID=A0A917YQZ0_9ACTN|nr:ABATE domain-containing protein [Nonomuraea cavernae]MCA2183520.1 ABATE domain-containing protein [Nonomuraea cavernae]GGO60544.1 hypothetical protein GCM10012289_00660 [Nonomuraea cavernae]